MHGGHPCVAGDCMLIEEWEALEWVVVVCAQGGTCGKTCMSPPCDNQLRPSVSGCRVEVHIFISVKGTQVPMVVHECTNRACAQSR